MFFDSSEIFLQTLSLKHTICTGYQLKISVERTQFINLVHNGTAINALKAAFRAAINEDRPDVGSYSTGLY